MQVLTNIILPLVVAVAGSGLVQFLITRSDKKHDQLAEIKTALSDLSNTVADNHLQSQRENKRLELMSLMQNPDADDGEIMKVAQYYFEELDGDWYMSSLFSKWLKRNNVTLPSWFNGRK